MTKANIYINMWKQKMSYFSHLESINYGKTDKNLDCKSHDLTFKLCTTGTGVTGDLTGPIPS